MPDDEACRIATEFFRNHHVTGLAGRESLLPPTVRATDDALHVRFLVDDDCYDDRTRSDVHAGVIAMAARYVDDLCAAHPAFAARKFVLTFHAR